MGEVVDLHPGPETALTNRKYRLKHQKTILTRLDPDLPILAVVVVYKIQRRVLASPIHIRHLVL